MFKLEFKVNGRKVPAVRVGTEFAAAVKQPVQEQVLERIRSARCPTHQQSPSNVHGWPTVRFDGCCDELKTAVAGVLR
jgi:hypothetical protein